MPKIPYNQEYTPQRSNFNVERQETPIWASLLYGGVENRKEISRGLDALKNEPDLIKTAVGGLLGQYFLNENLPSNVDINLKNKSFTYMPNDKFNIGFSKEGDTGVFNMGWRF